MRLGAKWLYVVLFWTLLTVIYSTQLALIPRPESERASLWMTLTWQGIYYMAWAPVTLLVWKLTGGWDPERLGWRAFLIRHTFGSTLVTVAHSTGVVLLAVAIAGRPAPNEMSDLLWTYMRARIHTDLLIYAAIVAAGQALVFSDRYRERQLAAARLEAQLADARLETLRAQLHPHFLFNSLHSIASLARAGDNAAVVRLISGFSDLLRHLLDSRLTHHALGEELSLVDRYLDIQRVRFGDRLRVSIDVSPDAAGARVPLLVVQPLVENALRHGLAPKIDGGSLSVQARRLDGALVLEVIDDGMGLPAGWSIAAGSGTGLRNLSSRLAAEFGDRHTVTLTNRAGGGVRAEIRLPYVAA